MTGLETSAEAYRKISQGGRPKLLAAVQQDLQPCEVLFLAVLVDVVESCQDAASCILKLQVLETYFSP